MIDPELSLISVGRNNYGHPSKEILERLWKAGSRVETTLERGALQIESDGDTFSLSLQRGED
jgi:competence protein ComEC